MRTRHQIIILVLLDAHAQGRKPIPKNQMKPEAASNRWWLRYARHNSPAYLVAIFYRLHGKHCSKEIETEPRQDQAANLKSVPVTNLAQPVGANHAAICAASSASRSGPIGRQYNQFVIKRCIGQARHAVYTLAIIEVNLIAACGTRESTHLAGTFCRVK